MEASHLRRLGAITFGLLLLLLAWDASGLDMWLARFSGGPRGFPLDEYWLFTRVFHDGGRLVSWALVMWLTLCVWWPMGWLRQLQSRERGQLVVSTLLAVLLISGLKSFSTTSCPWDLAAFGGTARHVSHWIWGPDGGSGRCFPAGHASSGFAFIGGYFVFRRRSPNQARAWLGLSVLAGFVLGAVQQMRGAHFMSHTLWTAWLCWTFALVFDALWRYLRSTRKPAALSAVPSVLPRLPRPDPARDPAPSNPATPLHG